MSPLDSLQVATPCPMKWSQMKGDERTRHCDRCKLNVYNLSAMTAPEATRLITLAEGRICATFFRRDDGTVLTRDCEGGLKALFFEKYGAVEKTGPRVVVIAAVTAAIFALGVTIFGDNVRMLFGYQTTGALAGDVRVTKRPAATRHAPARSDY